MAPLLPPIATLELQQQVLQGLWKKAEENDAIEEKTGYYPGSRVRYNPEPSTSAAQGWPDLDVKHTHFFFIKGPVDASASTEDVKLVSQRARARGGGGGGLGVGVAVIAPAANVCPARCACRLGEAQAGSA